MRPCPDPEPERDPEPEPEDDAPVPDPGPERDAEPEPVAPSAPPDDTPPPEEEPPPDEAPAPAETEETEEEDAAEGGEDLNVRQEAFVSDHPVYYENIIRQIHRCFRWQGEGGYEAVVTFVIPRDGSTSDIDVAESSGNFAFDLEVHGAVECAGNQGRLGALPDDYALDFLPIRFTFSPSK